MEQENREWRAYVQEKLGDFEAKGPMSPSRLGMLRGIGMKQLSMQTSGLGSIDTQAVGALAAAGALAALDVALDQWLWLLVMPLIAALFALLVMIAGKPAIGPSPEKIMRMRSFLDPEGKEVILDDIDVEWLVVGDVEDSLQANAKLIDERARAVLCAAGALFLGVVVLMVLEIADPAQSSVSRKSSVYHVWHAPTRWDSRHRFRDRQPQRRGAGPCPPRRCQADGL